MAASHNDAYVEYGHFGNENSCWRAPWKPTEEYIIVMENHLDSWTDSGRNGNE